MIERSAPTVGWRAHYLCIAGQAARIGSAYGSLGSALETAGEQVGAPEPLQDEQHADERQD